MSASAFAIPGAPAELMARINERRNRIPAGMVKAESEDDPKEPEQPAGDAEEPKGTDWKAESRKWEKRAKENDEARKELDAIREAQKSDAEKAADKLATETQRADTATALAARYRIALDKRVSREDADLFMTAPDEETLEKQADRLAARVDHKPGYIPTQGTGDPKPKGSDYSSGRERALAKQQNNS